MEVNTKRSCFLCLRHIFGDTWALDEDNSPTDCYDRNSQPKFYNLKPILRMIAFAKDNIFDTKYNDDSVSVSLCSQCGTIVEHLTSLCIELELVQMKINWKLGQVTEIIQDSAEDAERSKLFRHDMLFEEFGEENYELAETLRKTLITKCTKRLSLHKVPKVQLENQNWIEISNPEYEDTNDEESVDPLLVDHLSEPPSPEYSAPPAPPTSCTLVTTKEVEKGEKMRIWECEKCGKVVTNRKCLHQHKKNYCEFGEKLPPPGSLICGYCGILATSRWHLYNHRKKVHALDIKMGRVETMKPVKFVERTGEQVECDKCGNVLANKGSWYHHKRLYCSFRKRLTPVSGSSKCSFSAPAVKNRCDLFQHKTNTPYEIKENLRNCSEDLGQTCEEEEVSEKPIKLQVAWPENLEKGEDPLQM